MQHVIELFAGCGGASLGIERATPNVTTTNVWAVERDADAVATLTASWVVGRILHADVHDAIHDLPTDDVELLWASPPCQPYSRAGKRLGAADARDCWPVTLEAIMRCRPRCVVIENVRGSPADAWAEQIAALGYASAVWDLDAADYGVPQRRHRRFVVAWRDQGCTAAPAPTHSRVALDAAKVSGEYQYQVRAGLLGLDTLATRDAAGRRPWNTIRAALPGLVGWANETNHGGRPMAWHAGHEPGPTPVAGGKALGGILGVWVRTEQVGAVAVGCDEASPTVPTVGNQYVHTGDVGRRDKHAPQLLLGAGRRRLTPLECAALQGFPADWPWKARTKSSHYRQVGNAVPPRLAEAVVRAVLR